MHEGTDVFDKNKDLNVWTSIWIKPRETVRYALNHKTMKFAVILALITGVFDMLNGAVQNNLGDTMSITTIFVLAILLGPILGVIGWWIAAGIATIVGLWFGGTGTFTDLKMAFAISYIPIILGGVLWIPDVLILGEALFMENFDISVGSSIWLFISGFFSIVLGVWSFIITVKAIAEAHKFSAWRGLWTVLIPATLVILVLFIIFLPFFFLGF
ncbi:Yip1 family protein [Sporosarcina sp. FSL K6-1522]|uniref:Yip1 family protein n=1 Tax=Sporosarcina sp. FSL K6-1522 TaxID=2921554 RepID=UPI00315A5761